MSVMLLECFFLFWGEENIHACRLFVQFTILNRHQLPSAENVEESSRNGRNIHLREKNVVHYEKDPFCKIKMFQEKNLNFCAAADLKPAYVKSWVRFWLLTVPPVTRHYYYKTYTYHCQISNLMYKTFMEVGERAHNTVIDILLSVWSRINLRKLILMLTEPKITKSNEIDAFHVMKEPKTFKKPHNFQKKL